MAWRPHGRARVNARNPVAFAKCDRCQFLVNRTDLNWQFEYAGPNLQNLRILVCDECLDVPQPQLKTFVLPPDPSPVIQARVEGYIIEDVAALRQTQDSAIRITESGLLRIVNTSAATPA